MMVCRLSLLVAAMVCLVSCGDEPVMKVTERELIGTWECGKVLERMRKAVGQGAVFGPLILKDNGTCVASGFPMTDPLRLTDESGVWEVIEPERTPSGISSVFLDSSGTFLSVWRRGGKLVLRYPVDVLENHRVEYFKKE